MLNIIKKLFYFFRFRSLKNHAIIGNNFLFSKKTKIVSQCKDSIVISDNVMLFGKLIAQDGGKIFIGKNTSIRNGCIIYSAKNVKIGNNVIFADNIIVSDTNHHPVNPADRLTMIRSGWSTPMWSWKFAKATEVIIGDNVWIGQYARIIKGVSIGNNSIVASNSVVTKDVPENSIVAGNPAKIVKSNIDEEPKVFI